MALQTPVISTDDLRAYHAKHFPHALPPEHFMHGYTHDVVENGAQGESESLGYYPDGTKRTITDGEIAYLRYTEIRAILRKRREQQASSGEPEDGEISSQQEDRATPASASNSAAIVETGDDAAQNENSLGTTDNVISGRIEKPAQQKWTTSSARTKARNKRNRDKYRAKKKEQGRLIRERAYRGEDEADESDEWDPWHQATGPDVQKDEKVDLDY